MQPTALSVTEYGGIKPTDGLGLVTENTLLAVRFFYISSDLTFGFLVYKHRYFLYQFFRWPFFKVHVTVTQVCHQNSGSMGHSHLGNMTSQLKRNSSLSVIIPKLSIFLCHDFTWFLTSTKRKGPSCMTWPCRWKIVWN